jgi:hypothetical protein
VLIDNSFAAVRTNTHIPLQIDINMTTYPALPADILEFQANARNSFLKYSCGMWMTLVFSFTFFVLIADLVTEKETKIRESMKVQNWDSNAVTSLDGWNVRLCLLGELVPINSGSLHYTFGGLCFYHNWRQYALPPFRLWACILNVPLLHIICDLYCFYCQHFL